MCAGTGEGVLMGQVLAGHSKELHEWLKRCGISCDMASRVVIDIKVNSVVKIYIEQYGSDQLLMVNPPDFSRAKVEVLKKADG